MISFWYIIILLIVFLFFLYKKNEKNEKNNIKDIKDTKDTKEPFSKKRIAICLTGQVRTNSCCTDVNTPVFESWEKYFLNDEFKNAYEYDFYISTDKDIDIEKTLKFLGEEHIKNIHFFKENTEIDSYYKPCKKLKEYKKCYNVYKNKMLINKDIITEPVYLNNFILLYRYYDCLNMIEKSGIKYDYIINTRFDTIFMENINNYISQLNEIILFACRGNIFIVGKEDIMKYHLNIMEVYGDYNYLDNKYQFKDGGGSAWYNSDEYYKINYVQFKNSNELQIAEHFFNYCKINNLNVDKSLKSINPENVVLIYR